MEAAKASTPEISRVVQDYMNVLVDCAKSRWKCRKVIRGAGHMRNSKTISSAGRKNGEKMIRANLRCSSASSPLVGFVRFHSRFRLARLAESCFLFPPHIALLWQRIFDEILQFGGLLGTCRTRAGTFANRLNLATLHVRNSRLGPPAVALE